MPKAVLVYIINDHKVCLGQKLRGINQGKWTGIGGKLEAGEDWTTCAIRECKEEINCQLKPELLKLHARLEFVNQVNTWKVRVFLTHQAGLMPQSTEEIKPQWFNLNQVPYHLTPQSDRLWLPALLSGYYLIGKFEYSTDKQLIYGQTKTFLHLKDFTTQLS